MWTGAHEGPRSGPTLDESSTLYRDIILPAACRVLGLLNRVPGAPYRGSFTRPVWRYRFGGRFHEPTRQCAVYPLARLYRCDFPGNPFFGDEALLENLRAAMAFTTSLQNRDGSFAEWYPGQPSACGTASVAANLSEAIRILPAEGAPEVRDRLLGSLDRAARWLGRRLGRVPSNQAAAALLALGNARHLLGDAWSRAVLTLRDALLSSQSPEGWFPEDGGPDAGYQTLTLDFLARAHDRGVEGLSESIGRGMAFLARAVMPDGSSPAALATRGTNFLSPFAAERWAAESPAALSLAARIRGGIASGRLPTPPSVDDRYLAHIFLPAFVDAHFAAGPLPAAGDGPPGTAAGEALFVDPGERLVSAILSRRGQAALFSRALGRVVLDDRAYVLERADGLYLPEPSGEYVFRGALEFSWASRFSRARGGETGTRAALLLWPAVSRAALALPPSLGRFLESRVRAAAFSPGRRSAVGIRRTIDIRPGKVRITDVLSGPRGFGATLRPFSGGAPGDTPSSHWFAPGVDAPRPDAPGSFGEAARAAWSRDRAVEAERTFEADGSGVTMSWTVNGRSGAGRIGLEGLLR